MLFMVCVVTFSAHAQLATADLSLSTIPINPQPLQNVQIRLNSNGFDLTQASIVWVYNGATVASGIGKTMITVVAPANGRVGTISATANGSDFSATTATLILRPASVDVLWEGADSYTPPFYKGRALPANNGLIRVVAIPTISAPRGLTYTWQENDSALPDASGYEKSSLVFRNQTLNTSEDITLSVSSSLFSGAGEINITPVRPNLLAYFNTNGYIDYANGSSSLLNTSGNGAIIHFEPFYFSLTTTSISNDLTFSYTDNNNNNIETGDSQNEVRLSRPDGGGQSQFTAFATTSSYSLQNATRLFSISFN